MIVILSYILIIFSILYIMNRNAIISLYFGKQKFRCIRCGRCCSLKVRLTKDDIKRLKKFSIDKHIILKKGKPYIRQINGYCPFLNIKGGRASCSCYEDRPEICRTFPKRIVWSMDAYDYRCKAFKKGIFRYI